MPDSRPSFKEIFREIPFWILLVVTIAYFYRPLFLGETFFFRDIYNHIYPQKRLFSELVLSGQLPLWDPYRHGGQPFLANMNNSVLYPSNLLYLIMPTVTALNIDIVLHIGLAALAAYVLARVLGFNPFAAAASGLIYAFSGPSLSLPNIWPYAALHPPLMILFWHLYCLENNKRWFLLTVLFGAIQIFAGHPEMTAFTFATLLVWTIAFPYKRKVISRFGSLILLFIAILATAAIQLVPMMELVGRSGRSHGIRHDVFFAWSVNPKRYPELFFPRFLGSVYSISESDQWGMSLEELGTPYILSLYFGVSVLLLAIMGGVNKVSNHEFPRRVRILLLILIAFSFVAMAGRHFPGFTKLIDLYPFIAIFRYPVKFVLIALLPIALLAGFQLNQFTQTIEARTLRIPLAISSFIATSFALLLAFLLLFPSRSSHLLGNYFSSDGNAALKGLRYSVLHAAGFSILLTLCFTLASLRKRYRLDIVLSLLIGFDLLVAGSAVNHYAPREFLTDIPDLPIYIKKQIGDGKLYRTPDRFYPNYKVSSDIVFSDRTRLETLSNYVASMYGIPVVFHEDYDWLENDRMSKLGQKLLRLPWDQQHPILSSAGVRFVLTSDQIQIPGLHLVRTITNPNNIRYFLYRNESCTGSAFFASNSTIETDSNKLLNMLKNPNFDPCTTVLLDHSTVASGMHAVAKASVKLNKSSSGSNSYLVVTDKPGFLVLTEPFTPGWKWIIDGWAVDAVRANFAFQAVAVPAGKHQIDRIYRPASVIIGSAISLISLLSLTIAVLSKKTIIVPTEVTEPS
ncbi:YfhO family protein [bacterium]|nr:YfhO family protein [bacterium]